VKLYKISRKKQDTSWDEYDSAIVCANDEQDAAHIHPNGKDWVEDEDPYSSWTPIKNVLVELVGEAKEGTKRGVILSSFNAG